MRQGDTTRWHRLENTVERYVILSGCGKLEAGDTELVFLALCTPRFQEQNYIELAE